MKRTAPPGYRIVLGGTPNDDGFCADSKSGKMRIIAAWGDGWDHVSVSHEQRCPTWEEMEHVARHFWPNETAMQLHVAAADHINNHRYCLHWWRPQHTEIPKPPEYMV